MSLALLRRRRPDPRLSPHQGGGALAGPTSPRASGRGARSPDRGARRRTGSREGEDPLHVAQQRRRNPRGVWDPTMLVPPVRQAPSVHGDHPRRRGIIPCPPAPPAPRPPAAPSPSPATPPAARAGLGGRARTRDRVPPGVVLGLPGWGRGGGGPGERGPPPPRRTPPRAGRTVVPGDRHASWTRARPGVARAVAVEGRHDRRDAERRAPPRGLAVGLPHIPPHRRARDPDLARGVPGTRLGEQQDVAWERSIPLLQDEVREIDSRDPRSPRYTASTSVGSGL